MPEPTAQVEMTPPVDVLPKKSTEKCCGDKNCDTCLKGGMPMKKELLSFLVIIMVGLSTLFFTLWVVEMRKSDASGMNLPVAGSMEEKELAAALFVMPEPIPAVGTVALPKPDTKGELSVEEALASRRSIRTFEETPVSLSDVSQMLWAGQGVTDDSGHRTAPSARGLYPHTLYVIVRNVDGVKPGLYRYESETHALSDLGVADAGDRLIAAEVQPNSQTAPVVIAIGTAFAKMQEKFPDDPQSVSDLEAGHIGQNIYLQAQSLGLGTVVTAGFNPVAVVEQLGLDQHETITYLIPFGYPAPVVEEEAAH